MQIPPKFPKIPLDTPVLLSIIDRMTIDATIQRLTNDGEVVVQFLVDVIQGTNYNAPLGHRIKSAEWLSALGGFIPEDAIPKSASIRPRPKSEPKRDKPDKADNRDKNLSVTEKQILHFDIARLIKQETNDGETVVEFLIRVISKIEKSGENFTPAARMRAAKELLIRGFGSAIPGVSRILSGKTEDLDSYLSKIVREYTDHGADSVRFLVKAMENKTPEVDSKGAQTPYPKFDRQRKGKPAVGFTASQRVWAACELLRRAYDIRTDHITPDDIQAYWKSQSPAAAADHHAAGERPAAAQNIAAAEKPAHNRQPAANSDGAPAAETRADRRRQKRADRKAQKSATAADKRNAAAENPAITTQKRDADKQPAVDPGRAISEQPAAAANIAAAEKPAITAEKRDADKRNAAAEKPAHDRQPAANPDSAPAAETRASRRRQKRAARKAQKRAANTRNDTPARSVYPEDIANIEAYKQRLQAKSDAIRDAKLRNADIRKIPELKRHITPEEVAAFQRQPGNLYNRTREMYKEKYGEYPFPDDIPPNARSP